MSIKKHSLNLLQRLSLTMMAVLTILTFVGANLHALLWQSSDWLVSTVLPAVVVELTNEQRTDNAAVPLQRNTTLDQAAQLKAEHMAANEYFSHFSPDGVSPWHWFNQAGYVYAHAGENLAIHFTDSSEVVDAWMDSPTHRENIVNGLYTEIGVGTARGEFDGYETVYVVQLFGTPAIPPTPSPPLEVLPELKPALNSEIDNILAEINQINETIDALAVYENESIVAEAQNQPVLIAESVTDLPESEDIEVVTDEAFIKSESQQALYLEMPESVQTTESLLANNQHEVFKAGDSVVVESSVIAISSGLEAAQTETMSTPHAGATIAASIATQPNTLLQLVYTALALVVVMMLGTSIVLEARRLNYQQVAYGFLLLFGMGGLWFLNSILTTGAVIV